MITDFWRRYPGAALNDELAKDWIFDNIIGAFLMLLDQDTVFALDTVFVTMLQQAIHNNYIATHPKFLEFFFG